MYPHFRLKEMIAPKNYKVSHDKFIEGNLVNIKREIREYNKVKREVVVLMLEDDTEIMNVDIEMNNLGHNIINTLAGAKDKIGKVKISLYTNKAGYPASFVLVNDEKCERKHSFETRNALITTEQDRFWDVKKNYSKVDDLILDEVDGIYENIAEVKEFAKSPDEEDILEQKTRRPEPIDDLPF